MKNTTLTNAYLRELEAEYTSSKKCIERIPETLFEYKPHPKSMNLGYLTLLVAEIPLWIKHTITDGVIDFATFKHIQAKTTKEMVNHFEENYQGARKALQQTTDDDLQQTFELKTSGQLLYSSSRMDCVSSTINHWVHHRGQLTVYMRLNDILVPSIYGPSADDKSYAGQPG